MEQEGQQEEQQEGQQEGQQAPTEAEEKDVLKIFTDTVELKKEGYGMDEETIVEKKKSIDVFMKYADQYIVEGRGAGSPAEICYRASKQAGLIKQNATRKDFLRAAISLHPKKKIILEKCNNDMQKFLEKYDGIMRNAKIDEAKIKKLSHEMLKLS